MRSSNLLITLVALAVVVVGGVALRVERTSTAQSARVSNSTDVTYPCTEGGTALAALQAQYPVDTKDTSYGKQVMAINHVNPADQHYWAFYIDGTSATVGADAYQCQGTETIAWKLASF